MNGYGDPVLERKSGDEFQTGNDDSQTGNGVERGCGNDQGSASGSDDDTNGNGPRASGNHVVVNGSVYEIEQVIESDPLAQIASWVVQRHL